MFAYCNGQKTSIQVLPYITAFPYKNKSPKSALLLADSTDLFTGVLSRTIIRQQGKILRGIYNNTIV